MRAAWVCERQAPMSVVDDSPAPASLAALKATLAKLESSSSERLALDRTLKQIHQVTPPAPSAQSLRALPVVGSCVHGEGDGRKASS